MAILLNTKSYQSDRVTPDSVTYAGPAHSFTTKDTVELKRVYPKATKEFRGVARPSIKTVRTVMLDNGTTSDVILLSSGSIPVGISPADLACVIDDHVAALALEKAGTLSVFTKGDISY